MLIPKDNEKDLAEIPDNVKRGLEIITVSNVQEVLENALVSPLAPIEWDEKEELKAATLAKSQSEEEDAGGIIKH